MLVADFNPFQRWALANIQLHKKYFILSNRLLYKDGLKIDFLIPHFCKFLLFGVSHVLCVPKRCAPGV